jgi:hypothetical protein
MGNKADGIRGSRHTLLLVPNTVRLGVGRHHHG